MSEMTIPGSSAKNGESQSESVFHENSTKSLGRLFAECVVYLDCRDTSPRLSEVANRFGDYVTDLTFLGIFNLSRHISDLGRLVLPIR
jgi:hypothetical protein